MPALGNEMRNNKKSVADFGQIVGSLQYRSRKVNGPAYPLGARTGSEILRGGIDLAMARFGTAVVVVEPR